jgi:hypothetical protein
MIVHGLVRKNAPNGRALREILGELNRPETTGKDLTRLTCWTPQEREVSSKEVGKSEACARISGPNSVQDGTDRVGSKKLKKQTPGLFGRTRHDSVAGLYYVVCDAMEATLKRDLTPSTKRPCHHQNRQRNLSQRTCSIDTSGKGTNGLAHRGLVIAGKCN